VGEGRKWRAVALEHAASRHSLADDPSRNAAIFEQPARIRSAIGRERSQQRSRGEGTPGVGAQGAAYRAAGLEPEYGFFIDSNLNSGRVGEFVEPRREPTFRWVVESGCSRISGEQRGVDYGDSGSCDGCPGEGENIRVDGVESRVHFRGKDCRRFDRRKAGLHDQVSCPYPTGSEKTAIRAKSHHLSDDDRLVHRI
jgi:hypothetical protein